MKLEICFCVKMKCHKKVPLIFHITIKKIFIFKTKLNSRQYNENLSYRRITKVWDETKKIRLSKHVNYGVNVFFPVLLTKLQTD